MRRTEQRRAAVFACYQRAVTGTPIDELAERGALTATPGGEEEHIPTGRLTDFARDLVEGVEEHREQLDELISDQAVDWSVERIAPLERSIMRVALYEILYRDDVPEEVAIDEAVENTKIFCGAEAPAFVNGILGGVVRRLASGGVPGGGGHA